MRLKLKESVQPISKLDYNIQNIVLPTLNKKYGFKFVYPPRRTGDYKYIFSYFNKERAMSFSLTLTTSDTEIDIWNDQNSDIFIADLFMEISIMGKVAIPGPISSKSPKSIIEQTDSSDLPEVFKNVLKLKSPEEAALIPPKYSDPSAKNGILKMSPHTAEEWKEMGRKTTEMYNNASSELRTLTNEELYKYYDMFTNEETRKDIPENIKKDIAVQWNYIRFMEHVYPLDDEYTSEYKEKHSGHKPAADLEGQI